MYATFSVKVGTVLFHMRDVFFSLKRAGLSWKQAMSPILACTNQEFATFE